MTVRTLPLTLSTTIKVCLFGSLSFLLLHEGSCEIIAGLDSCHYAVKLSMFIIQWSHLKIVNDFQSKRFIPLWVFVVCHSFSPVDSCRCGGETYSNIAVCFRPCRCWKTGKGLKDWIHLTSL